MEIRWVSKEGILWVIDLDLIIGYVYCCLIVRVDMNSVRANIEV